MVCMLHALLVPRSPVDAHPADRPPAAPRPHYRTLTRTRALHLRVVRPRRLSRPVLWALGAALVLLAASPWAVQAQNIYRTVGADGRVTFSDRLSTTPAAQPSAERAGKPGSPAPASDSSATATDSPAPAQATDSMASADLPYTLRQAHSKYPVTLYATGDCPPCDDARRMLVQRGVPYTERSVISDADRKALQALSGQEQLPFATIGQQHLVGWEADSWQRYLDLAGYPSRSAMPRAWKPSAATALAPQPPQTPSASAAAPPPPATPPNHTAASGPRPASAPKANPANPAGITF